MIFAIFSADWPIVSPVDGSAIAGVIGTRSFGRIEPSDAQPLRRALGAARSATSLSDIDARVQDRHVRQRFRAAGDDDVVMAEHDLIGGVGDRLVRRRAGAAHGVRLAALAAASACSETSRAMFGASTDGTTVPYTIASTRSPSRLVRWISSATQRFPSSMAVMSLNAVPARANGVRTPATIATRRPGVPSDGMTGSDEGRGRGLEVVPRYKAGRLLPVMRAARAPDRAFAALGDRAFDLLVIGGGDHRLRHRARRRAARAVASRSSRRTTSRAARRAARRGSIHGGVRYLEHGHLHLVFESSAERRRSAAARAASRAAAGVHLAGVRRRANPALEARRRADAVRRAGAVPKRRPTSAAESRRGARRASRCSRSDGLLGGASYFDAATNDARLTLANAIGAAEAGAVVLNHAPVTALWRSEASIAGATVQRRDQRRRRRGARTVVVNATGPWSDDVRGSILAAPNSASRVVRGSKGAHIAVPRARVGNRDALTLLSPRDGRVLFVLPAQDTRDRRHDRHVYVVVAGRRARDERRRAISARRGERVLSARSAHGERRRERVGRNSSAPADARDTPGAASREHAVVTSASGLVSITGGKLTTYRVMARDVVRVVLDRLRLRAGRATAPRRCRCRAVIFGRSTA